MAVKPLKDARTSVKGKEDLSVMMVLIAKKQKPQEEGGTVNAS